MGIEVEGLREKVKALEKASVEVDELKDVMASIATEAAQTLASYTPSMSGKLRGTVRGNRAKGSATVTVGRASVPYAGPIIYGWPHRHIPNSQAVERTDAVMDDRAAELLEDGFNAIIERNGL